MILGLKLAPNTFIIIHCGELGNPYTLPNYLGRNSVRSNDGAKGRGDGNKRMATCNELHRGSKFALTLKGADLPAVFHCMNGGKLMDVRYSITLKSERLTDA